MRKHFLILMLMALLPMAGFAADFATEAVASTGDKYFGNAPVSAEVTVVVNSVPVTAGKYKIEDDGALVPQVYYYTDAACTVKAELATGKTTPNAGNYYLKIVPTDDDNSNFVACPIIIRPMPLTIAVTNASKTYGQADPASYAITSIEDNDGNDVKAALLSKVTVIREAGENVKPLAGTYNFNSTTVSDPNYTIGTVTGTFTINAKPFVLGSGAGTVTVTVSDNVKTYTGVAQAPTVQIFDNDLNKYLDAKDFALSYAGGDNISATAAAGVQVTITGARNYAATACALPNDADHNLIINKATLNIFVDDVTKVYDGTQDIPAVTFTYSGAVGADATKANPFGDNFEAVYAVATGNKFAVANYPLKAQLKAVTNFAGTNWNNYTVNYPVIGQLTVTKRPVTITVTDDSKSFGEADPAFAYTVAAAPVPGNTGAVAVVGNFVTGKTDKQVFEELYNVVRSNKTVQDVGTYDGVLELEVKAAASADAKKILNQYTITEKKGQFKINAASLLVTPKKVIKTYGEDYDINKFEVIATNSVGIRVELTTKPHVEFKKAEYNEENPTDAGIYQLVLVGDIAAPGYDGAAAIRNEGQLIINKKPLTVELGDQTLMVGDKETALRASKVMFLDDNDVNGIVGDDVIGYKLEFNTYATQETYEAGLIPNITAAAVAADVKYTQAECNTANAGITGFQAAGAEVGVAATMTTANGYSKNYADNEALVDNATDIYLYNTNIGAAKDDPAYITTDDVKIPAQPASVDGLDTEDKLTTVTTYNKGVKISAVASTEENPNQNANYEITFAGVTGKLIVVAANGLALLSDDEDITNITKIAGSANPVITSAITLDLNVRNSQKLPSTATDKRIWDAKQWNTLVLPFDIDVADLSAAFGYAIVNVVDPSSTTTNNVAFKLEMDMIPANTPFLIKTTKKLKDADAAKCISTTGVITFAAPVGGRTIAAPTTAQKAGVDAGMGYKFVPVYETKTVDKDQSVLRFLLGNYEKWAYILSTSENTWDLFPFTAYVDLTPAGSNAREVTFTMQEADGSTTTIRSIDADGINNNAADFANGWYTINGMKLEGAPAQKGIYIMNGKKVVIK